MTAERDESPRGDDQEPQILRNVFNAFPTPLPTLNASSCPPQAEMYAAGEELFALKSTQHPELVKIKKEACLLDQLYGLYMDVIHTLERCDKDPDLSIRENMQIYSSPMLAAYAYQISQRAQQGNEEQRKVHQLDQQYYVLHMLEKCGECHNSVARSCANWVNFTTAFP